MSLVLSSNSDWRETQTEGILHCYHIPLPSGPVGWRCHYEQNINEWQSTHRPTHMTHRTIHVAHSPWLWTAGRALNSSWVWHEWRSPKISTVLAAQSFWVLWKKDSRSQQDQSRLWTSCLKLGARHRALEQWHKFLGTPDQPKNIVWICVYVCVCVYLCVCIYMHTFRTQFGEVKCKCKNPCSNSTAFRLGQWSLYMCVCVCVCEWVCVCVCVCVCVPTCIHFGGGMQRTKGCYNG